MQDSIGNLVFDRGEFCLIRLGRGLADDLPSPILDIGGVIFEELAKGFELVHAKRPRICSPGCGEGTQLLYPGAHSLVCARGHGYYRTTIWPSDIDATL